MAVDPDAPIFANEPALTVGVVGAVIVTLASVFGVGLDITAVETTIADAIILIGSVVTRSKVTPYHG